MYLSIYLSFHPFTYLSILSLSICRSFLILTYLVLSYFISSYLTHFLYYLSYLSIFLSIHLSIWSFFLFYLIYHLICLSIHLICLSIYVCLFANLKTKLFCNTSYQCVLRFSSLPVESIAPATKNWYQVIRSTAPITQNHFSKPQDLILQNATPRRKLPPHLLRAPMKMFFVLRLPRKNYFCRSSLNVQHNTCHPFWKWYKTLTFCSFLTRSTIPCACHANRHLNLQKRRIHVVFCTCWLRNVLRATTACNFSSLICSEPTFRPSRAINHVKNTVFHNFHTLCRICISFFLLTLPLLWSSLFYSSLWLFLSLLFICPYSRKFDV